MALIAYDGFDHYNSAGDMDQRSGVLQWAASTGILSAGRAGYGKALSMSYTEGLRATLRSAVSQLTCGFAINPLGAGNAFSVSFIDAYTGTTQCSFGLNFSNYIVTLYDANGAAQSSGLNLLYANGWHFIECQALIGSGTSGSMALRVNGQGALSASGIKTQMSANASVSSVNWPSVGASTNYDLDDIYFADGTTGPGSYPNNSFLGDVRSATLFPISNSAVAWVPLANTNWQEVSETAMDSDTSYNRTATAGAQDSFNLSALDVDVNQVVGLQVTVAVRKEDAGSRTVAPVVVIAGVTYVGTAVSVDVSYLYITSLWPINPGTGASWTAADVNGMQAGYVVVT